MTPEERFDRIERQLEFLAAWHAQTTSAIDRHTEQIGHLGDFLLRTARFVEQSTRRTEERFSQVAGWQRDVGDEMRRLALSQQRTEESLNILIHVVERYFSGNGRN